MDNKYINRLREFNDSFIVECLGVICDCVSKSGGIIVMGNCTMCSDTNSEGKVVPFVDMRGEHIELYSDDGWTKLEDIARWADVCCDYIKKRVELGADRYSIVE